MKLPRLKMIVGNRRLLLAHLALAFLLSTCRFTDASTSTPHGVFDAIIKNDISNILHTKNLGTRGPKTDFHANEANKKRGRVITENIAHGFDEHEVIVPIRLHHVTGHPVSHGRHFRKRSRDSEDHPKRRRRRDLGAEEDRLRFLRNMLRQSRNDADKYDVTGRTYYDVIPDDNTSDFLDFTDDVDDVDHRVANFSLNAFGEKFLLHLTPYEDFLAPNYTLHYMGDPRKDKALHPDVPRHCFYSGYVNGRPEHRAVLSVCRGLFGAFRTDTSDYLIQPEVRGSNPHHDNDDDDEGTKPHRIFKRSTRAAGSMGKQLCGFTESDKQPLDRRRQDESTFLDDQVIDDLRNLVKSKEDTSRENENLFTNHRRAEAARRLRHRKLSKHRHRFTLLSSKMNSTSSRNALKRLRDFSLATTRSLLRVLASGSVMSSTVTSQSGEEEVLSRKKRYLSYPRNVEVMVTADNAMLTAHDDVEHYVLTLMAIVNHVYHDPSIQNLINIVLVKLVVIGDSQVNNGPRVERDAHACLRNFCDWQFRQNDPDDSHPNHHDTSVLITGRDICRAKTACDTLGLAELGTMCDLRRSCSINEDNGLSTAFTIAHEIGHEFNAPHDNNERCLDARGRTVGLNVMSPTLDNNAHPWSWSKCSAKYITSFLDNGNGQCLLDEPPQRVLSLPIEEPGQVFDANAQCSFVYGKGVNHCNFMFQNTCTRLWCISQNISHGCRTPHVPWADGTRCGVRMWCQRGQCVPEDRDRIPVDGSWGEWSRFGECSRTCGGGIKSAVRECNNPKPQYGGRFCTGKRKKFRPCGFQECPADSDFRAEQCAAFNDWSRHHTHRIKGISPDAQWIPKYDGILLQDRCKLICQVKSDEQYAVPWYVLKPKVINGTPCGPETHDICVEGVCKMAGCDHVLNSRTTEDSCGVCNGDNTACRRVQGSYNAGYNIGYNQVVVIPAGANNIIITQRSYSGDPEDNNYLALRDGRGNYILNGNRSVMKSKHKMHRRAARVGSYLYFCDYSGTDNIVERINCSKAIQTDIIVEVLSAGDLMPPNINYRYNVPIRDRVTYRWDPNGPWSTCSKVCGGKTKGKILCVRSDQQVVSDRRCHHLPKPSTVIRPCNTRCQLTWHQKPSECSVRCGSGNMNLEFECRKNTNTFNEDGSPGDRLVELVGDSLCPQPKPDSVAVCQGECFPTSWDYGDWSECSRTCGGGSQTRTGVCRDSRGQDLSANECENSERVVSRTCSNVPCPQWVVSSFSQCMVTCGTGVRQRRVWCSIRGALRPDSECNIRTKPSTTTTCTEHDCPRWSYEEWGPCSVTCGEGTAVRLYHCVDYMTRTVDDSECDTALLRQDTRTCSAPRDCDAWDYRTNDDFSSIVWRGLARRGPMPRPTRGTTTASTVPTTTRSTTTIPTTTTSTTMVTTTTSTTRQPSRTSYNNNHHSGVSVVNSRGDLARWRTGSWTHCSATCGPGIRLRYVSCRHHRGDREMREQACGPPDRKPPAKEVCEIRPCHGIWRTGSWSTCSASCGEGVRSRNVRCLWGGRYYDDDTYCTHDVKPSVREACLAATPCRTTTTTVATTTTSTTPTTTMSTTASTTTTASTLPSTTTSTTTIPSTTTSTIQRTNATSQFVIMNRLPANDVITPRVSVTSHDGGLSIVDRSGIDVDRNLHGQWRTGPWSRCSSTCGGGTQKRAVVCQSAVSESPTCDSSDQPASIQVCSAGICPRWKHGRWGRCSRSCDGGTRSRRVYCVRADGRSTYNHRCDVILRPIDVDACNMGSCPGEHRWRKSAWSACSVTCGRGTKNRQVTCTDGQDRPVSDGRCANLRKGKPREVRKCVKQRRCPRWRTGKWHQCSATCGVGIKVRRVSCKYKRKVIVDDLCDVNSRPSDVTPCNVTRCPTYRWNADAWKPCSSTCGDGVMKRRVTCQTVDDGRVVDATRCDATIRLDRPSAYQKCTNGPCDAFWNIDSWSECSVSCGPGIQRRLVKCSHVDPITYTETDVTSCDASNRPYDVRDCNRGRCGSPVHWRVGAWSECSTSCGEGTSVRRVVCSDRATQAALDDGICQSMPSFRPERTRACRTTPCIPVSCRHLKAQRSVTEDGEYFLKINGKMSKIYCKDMETSYPTEYVSLVSGTEENYSRIFGYRLINSDTCPSNGSRDENCACHRDHPDEGFTSFQKVRFDVTTMRILGNDFSFATTRFGKSVPFGVAGDCYSRNNCPQGEFHINLKGTGFLVSSNTRWRSYGQHSVRRTHRSHSGDMVAGVCGGYCSRCQPDPLVGLKLEHDNR